MKITLNGKVHELKSGPVTVSEFVAGLDIGEVPVLVEVNGEAVLSREFGECTLRDGDTVEVIRMVAGG